MTLLLIALLLGQQQPVPQKEESKPPTAASEPLKTLNDKVRERVAQGEEAMKASGTVLMDFEAELSGKLLSQVNFKQLADNLGEARSGIKETLKDADELLRQMDSEVLESMEDGEKLLFRKGSQQVDPVKAAKLTDTIRTVLQIHEILPADTLARTALETLSDSIDRSISQDNVDTILDVGQISQEVTRALMEYRSSLQESMDTLASYQTLLEVLEGNCRDLAGLLSGNAESPGKDSQMRVQTLVREISENQQRAVSIFKRLGRKIQDSKPKKKEVVQGTSTGTAAPAVKSRTEQLREKYLKSEDGGK